MAEIKFKYHVTFGNIEKVVEAPNKLEAWAYFCDGEKQWPNPKLGRVETEEEYKQRKDAEEQVEKQAVAGQGESANAADPKAVAEAKERAKKLDGDAFKPAAVKAAEAAQKDEAARAQQVGQAVLRAVPGIGSGQPAAGGPNAGDAKANAVDAAKAEAGRAQSRTAFQPGGPDAGDPETAAKTAAAHKADHGHGKK